MNETKKQLNVSIAQINVCVGDLSANTEKIINAIKQAKDEQHSDLVVFPELIITGYPPEDLLLRPRFLERIEQAFDKIAKVTTDITVVVGAPRVIDGELYNQAIAFCNGKIIADYSKQKLPNYRVFDEKRYFTAGTKPSLVEVNGIKLGLLVCEDIWKDEPVQQAIAAGAECLCVINASPFRLNKSQDRQELLQQQASQNTCPIIYSNLVGGQDELIFDGESLIYDKAGQLIFQAPTFESGVYPFRLDVDANGQAIQARQITDNKSIYDAIVLAVHDYVQKNGFSGVILGLSGGIDSALTLAIAVDALGAENVEAVMMPFKYTADISISDARKQAETMGVKYREIPIEPMFNAFMDALSEEFNGLQRDTTEENIQARSRGVLLMAMSNKLGKMLLATGNKSEMSVGYATLYGDMAGGFAPLKDVLKLRVYELSRYRNSLGQEVIPERVITRPPSAELAPDQKDEDSLPPYEILDDILQRFIEEYQCIEDIVAAGHEEATVKRVANMVLLNEYKRRQSAPGARITKRAFGKDRRYPITSAYRKELW